MKKTSLVLLAVTLLVPGVSFAKHVSCKKPHGKVLNTTKLPNGDLVDHCAPPQNPGGSKVKSHRVSKEEKVKTNKKSSPQSAQERRLERIKNSTDRGFAQQPIKAPGIKVNVKGSIQGMAVRPSGGQCQWDVDRCLCKNFKSISIGGYDMNGGAQTQVAEKRFNQECRTYCSSQKTQQSCQ